MTLLAGSALAIMLPSPASAQQGAAAPPADEPAGGDAELLDNEEIFVVGQRRGQVLGDIPPENVLNSRDVRATGAASVEELLEALAPQIGSARGRGGERPVLLLNGQRISGFRELRDIPTEAIQRVEVLPEEVALKYGYRADQRVVNFVLRPRFRSTTLRADAQAATAGGQLGGRGEVTRLMIGENGRTTVNFRADATGALTEAEREVALAPGRVDDREARTLVASQRLARATATHNRQLLGDVSATLNAEVERSRGRSLLGMDSAGLDPRRRDTVRDSAHAGAVLNGDVASWRWSLTGNADLARNITRTDPLAGGSRERARSTRASADVDATLNGRLFAVPAGDARATVRLGASTLRLDSERRRLGASSDAELGRSQGSAGLNLDLPVSRRDSGFGGLGNLTVNANGEVARLSDFGTLTTLGAGLNWSPAERLTLLASWTREDGAPGIEQLGEPLLETPGSRVFDFTRGTTALVTALTGGNPGLDADRRNVVKLGANWKPLDKLDLRFRADYVRSRLSDPVSTLPGASAALEAAFPDRFERDAGGELLRVDLRPVNFDRARRDTLRWGFDFSRPLASRRPSPAQIERFRALRQSQRSAGAGPDGPRREGGGGASAESRGGSGGGGFGRFGGGRQGGRLTFSLTHSLNLKDEVTIRDGLPKLDYLAGDALGRGGGRARHEVEAQAGWSNNGLGARLAANWRSGSRVDSGDGRRLRFDPLATFDLRLFANLGERFDLVAARPWLRGVQLRLEVDNLLDEKPGVRDAAGRVPLGYQPDLLDPLGRTVRITLRKAFLPAPGSFRRNAPRT